MHECMGSWQVQITYTKYNIACIYLHHVQRVRPCLIVSILGFLNHKLIFVSVKVLYTKYYKNSNESCPFVVLLFGVIHKLR